MTALIESRGHGVPGALTELITLGRTLKKRAEDVLAYFDRFGTSNGPTEAINGRPEHPRGSAPATGRGQSVLLGVGVLVTGRHPCVSDQSHDRTVSWTSLP